MKGVKFRLQKVLEVRELIEKQHKKDLASSKSKLKSEEEGLKVIGDKKNNFIQNLNKIEKATVSQILGHYDYYSALANFMNNKRSAVESLKGEVEKKRQNLLEASKDKKALENLKEKKIVEYINRESKKEQTLTDEIASRKKRNLNH